MTANIEESYILREYYKGFIANEIDLLQIKEKINKINREAILSRIVEQDKSIYSLISENYPNTYEILDKITHQINVISSNKKSSNTVNLFKENKENIWEQKCEIRLNDSLDEEFEDNKLNNMNDSINRESSSNHNNKVNKTTISNNCLKNNNNSQEPIAVTKIRKIILENKNKIDEYKNEIIDKKNLIKNKNKILQQQFDDLEEAIKEKDFLIENFDINYIINHQISSIEYSLLYILFKFFLNFSDKQMKMENYNLSIEEKKKILSDLFNKKNKKHIKKALFCVDETKLINSPNEDLILIKTNLDNIENETNDKFQENKFFYLLYKIFRRILDVTNIKNNISIERAVVYKEDKEIDKLIKNMNELAIKNKNFELAKKEILSKYENVSQKNQDKTKQGNLSAYVQKSTKFINMYSNNSINNQTFIKGSSGEINYSYPKTKNNNSNYYDSECAKSINELKVLISQLEKNYINLLKNLSKKILKPKSLLKKPDPDFFSSKIK